MDLSPQLCVAESSTNLGRSAAERDGWRVERGEQALAMMEKLLGAQAWMAGDRLSVAEIALIAYTRLANEGGFDLTGRPQVRQWIARAERALGIADEDTMNSHRKRILPTLIALALALTPLAAGAGNPHGDTPAAAGKPDKGKSQDKGKGKGKGKGKAQPGGIGGSHHGEGVNKAHGQDDGHHHHDREYWQRDWQTDEFLAAGFTAAILADLLGQDTTALHIGAKPLPPGIAKNLARGKPLPPGIAKRQPSVYLLSTLPRVQGHEWYAVGRDLVLVQAGTLIVTEILREIFD